jgi:hypothetical protein
MAQQKTRFKLYNQRTIRAELAELTDWQFTSLKSKTTKGVVWHQMKKGGIVLWNWTILHSILTHGLDSPITTALIEEYVATLPQSA